MSRAEQIEDIINQRRPLAKKIEGVEDNLSSLTAALRAVDERRNQLMGRVDPNISDRLKEINFSPLRDRIDDELKILGKLKARFSRPTLNLGVVGRARQGKSRLLQSLTGLSAAEIPDGALGHCTGVRSTIYHKPNEVPHGLVSFYSEQSFLEQVISPYYRTLRLGTEPTTIEEFAKMLPPLPSDLAESARFKSMYDYLRRYHDNLGEYRHLLGAASLNISQEQIREYVAQDTLDGRRTLFNYLAVQKVDIFCEFPNADVGQIALVDMPGLGDTGVGDAERLIKILGQEVDAVLFVRKPNPDGDAWLDFDIDLYETARNALKNYLPLNLWSFMLLNRVAGSSDNLRQCEFLAGELAKTTIDIVDPVIIANCADKEEANTKVLDEVLKYLTRKITSLDERYASSCKEQLSQLQKDVSVELNKARQAFAQPSPLGSEYQQFLTLFNEVYTEISYNLAQLLKNLTPQANAQDDELNQQPLAQDAEFFKQQVKAIIQKCKEDTGIPSIEEIDRRYFSRRGNQAWGTVYNSYLHKLRTNLRDHFSSLDNGLKQIVDDAKSQVAEVLVEKAHLGGLTEARGIEFLKFMAENVPDAQRQLKEAFQLLVDFEMSYKSHFQHRIVEQLDELRPDKTYRLPNKADAKVIREMLEALHRNTVSKCSEALEEFDGEPSKAAFATIEQFVDRVVLADGVEEEWQIFFQERRSQVWPSKFGQGVGLEGQEWQKLVERAVAANKLVSM